MSDDIPFEIQVEIIKKLPIKSVIQFRSVSKAWKSVIDSPNFIADYTVCNPAQRHHLLIRYDNLYSQEEIYESIVDDDTFPQNKFSLTVPPSVTLLWNTIVVGTSHGLVCLFGYYRYEDNSREATAVLWNPSIRKSVAIDVPGVDRHEGATFGFGVCPATIDPKIIKINDLHMNRKMRGEACSSLWKVEVYSLSSGVWRSSYCNLSDKLIYFKYSSSQAAIGGFFYWLGVEETIGSDTRFIYLISFDLSSEEFREIYLPNELAFHDPLELHVCKFRDDVAVLQEGIMDDIIEVWVTDNGDSKSFKKLFTINRPNMLIDLLHFSMNCDLMMTMSGSNEDSETLVAYEPFLEHINDLEIESQCYTLSVSSYTESLILLDQPECQIH